LSNKPAIKDPRRLPVKIDNNLANGVRVFLDSGNRDFLAILHGLEPGSLEAQATIRYLLQLKHWPLTPESDFAGLLEKFFGPNVPKTAESPEAYRTATAAMIQETWNYECVYIAPEPREEKPKKPNPGKRVNKPRMQSENDSVEEGNVMAKHYPDTKDASDRLKKVIAIQRAG
jgi:hypothetical protein